MQTDQQSACRPSTRSTPASLYASAYKPETGREKCSKNSCATGVRQVHATYRLPARNCDSKFARIAQKSSEVKAVAYRRWISHFPQPSVHQSVRLKQSPKSNCLSKKKGNKNAQNSQSCIVKQSISRCKTDYLALQGWLSWTAKLTILGRKVDYLGLQDTQDGATGSQIRHLEMLISTVPIVKIFRIPARCFAASQQNADSLNTRRKMWHTYITGGFYNIAGISLPFKLEDAVTFWYFRPLYTHYKIYRHIGDIILCIYFAFVVKH